MRPYGCPKNKYLKCKDYISSKETGHPSNYGKLKKRKQVRRLFKKITRQKSKRELNVHE